MNGLCNSRKVLASLGIQGDECKYSPDEKNMERSYKIIYAYQIAEALRDADIEQMRCEKCFYSLGGHGSRGLKCFCPKEPPHFVEKDFFCKHFEKRGQNK